MGPRLEIVVAERLLTSEVGLLAVHGGDRSLPLHAAAHHHRHLRDEGACLRGKNGEIMEETRPLDGSVVI